MREQLRAQIVFVSMLNASLKALRGSIFQIDFFNDFLPAGLVKS